MLNTEVNELQLQRKAAASRSSAAKIPNAATIAAIEEARAGKGLKSYPSVKAMFSDILGEDD